ncbi:short-chain fatty acyl-CoA regulator family protein [Rhodocyclus gracilis]|uniref:ImmA/IrrE family metallo-endopeptidase n=1 Tax=Rhodocyclus tenuis TaxID=1066 RepID=A0A6L5JWB2_RHOTE|nr:short-chain fatty acyl-CoA regulator family protein [Rhodocyclus gracilis]MQY51529.1 ImmA/IrrE family metallo-endopeptidase [Rhodocyclus gracilis]
MKKTFMGVRLKRLREERGLTQVALARALELSPSYLNQLEQNQRPLTVPVLLRLNAVFGVDVQLFSENDEARLIADLQEAFREHGAGEPVSQAEIRELAAGMPGVARTLLTLARRQQEAQEREAAWAARMGLDRSEQPLATRQPFEEVRDFFYARHNHIDELDRLAEGFADAWQLRPGEMADGLEARLRQAHGIDVRRGSRLPAEASGDAQREFDPATRTLALSPHLTPGQQAFQMATQLAFLEAGDGIDALAAGAALASDEARRLARIGLANYFAGALILPYTRFLERAEALRYDIERLGRAFGVEFETTCHRLSTLQRPEARGIPFFFVRVDRAGNISKRQSATDFHFSRIGGTCPLWNVYEAFAQPERVLTQLTAMPDGRAYLWIARTVTRGYGGYGAPSKRFAIGLGCDLQHAERLVYSKGLNLGDSESYTPIGAGCKVCPREVCPQRAFPAVGGALVVDENRRRFAPYPLR